MTEFQRKTVSDDGFTKEETMETTDVRPVTTSQTLEKGVHHGDEEVGGAVGGGVIGAVVGAVVGGPVGAVIGGAVGAAAGTTAGAVDAKHKDEEMVVTREETTR